MKRNRKNNPADAQRRIKGKFEKKSEESRKDWDRYENDVEKSEVHQFPNRFVIYDSSHTDENLEDDMLLYLSKLAICFYNIREGTYFGDVKVVMATRSGIKCENHYITFEAFLSESKRKRVAVTFQTHYLMPPPPPKNYKKPINYYHRTIILNYHTQLSESVAKHDIESLKVVKLMKPDAEVPTYHITYEAPLRGNTKRKNVETFKTEICMPSLFPTTVIEFKSCLPSSKLQL